MYYWRGKIPREQTASGLLPKSPAAFVPIPELNQHEVLPPLTCSQPLSVILPQNTLSSSASPLSRLSSPSLSPSVFIPALPLFSPAQGTDTWIQANVRPTQLLKGHKPAQNDTPIHASANMHAHTQIYIHTCMQEHTQTNKHQHTRDHTHAHTVHIHWNKY